jgi:hypothetical protein
VSASLSSLPQGRRTCIPPIRLAIFVLLAAGIPRAERAFAGTENLIFRPLTADPREDQFRLKFVRFTENWRYGTDVTDSTSVGGYEERTGVSWDVGIGGPLRMDPTRGPRWLGKLWQITVPASIHATFDRIGADLINVDYQFGGGLDVVWRGNCGEESGVQGLREPLLSTHLLVFHRSTHLGDEYITQGDFGRNQGGSPSEGDLFHHPPVKRVNVSFEAVRFIGSLEWPLRKGRNATMRVYGGGEWKVGLVRPVHPRNFNSPIGQAGLEFRSAGAAEHPKAGWPIAWINRFASGTPLVGEWLAGVDMKLARPFNFASCDNPSGDTEVWTPNLWSECASGREFHSYAAAWHGVAGYTIYLNSRRNMGVSGAGMIAPEFIVGFEFYSGYSPNGQALDQWLRYWGPAIIAHF